MKSYNVVNPYSFTRIKNKWLNILPLFCITGQDNCVETIIEQDKISEFSGNPFSPLHCAV